MNLIFLVFLILFWLISAIVKVLEKSGRQIRVKDELLFLQPQLEEIKPIYLLKDEAAHTKRPQQELKKILEEKFKTAAKAPKKPILKETTIETGNNFLSMLESKSVLKKAVILSEIMAKPVSER